MAFETEHRTYMETELRRQQEQICQEAAALYESAVQQLRQRIAAGDYTVRDGMAQLSCVVPMPARFLRVDRWDNFSQVAANNRKLIRNPFLKPTKTRDYSVVPELRESYGVFCNRFRQLAEKDRVTFEVILYNDLLSRERPFPGKTDELEDALAYTLAAKCTAVFTL